MGIGSGLFLALTIVGIAIYIAMLGSTPMFTPIIAFAVSALAMIVGGNTLLSESILTISLFNKQLIHENCHFFYPMSRIHTYDLSQAYAAEFWEDPDVDKFPDAHRMVSILFHGSPKIDIFVTADGEKARQIARIIQGLIDKMNTYLFAWSYYRFSLERPSERCKVCNTLYNTDCGLPDCPYCGVPTKNDERNSALRLW